MRQAVFVVVLAVLAAGCVKEPSTVSRVNANTTATVTPPTTPTTPAGETDSTEPAVDTTPRTVTAYFGPDYTLSTILPAEGAVPETVDPAAFYTQQASNDPAAWSPWKTGTNGQAREILGEVEVQLRIRAAQPAQQTTPKQGADFPGAGGWIGSGSGFNTFYLMHDAPERLEAGVIHKASARVQMPQGGLFLLPEEPFSPHPWTAYKTADGSPVEYVLGGDDPAFVRATLRTVDLPKTTAVELFTESGEMGPHPGITTAGTPDAATIPLVLPEGTVYVVVESSGAPVGLPAHIDIDFDVMKGGEVILGGHGPGTNEVVVIGPGNIAAYGRELSVLVSAASLTGNTWTLKATAYVAVP